MAVTASEQKRALQVLARHDGATKISTRTSVRSALVDYLALRDLQYMGLAYAQTNAELLTRAGLTEAGRKAAIAEGMLVG